MCMVYTCIIGFPMSLQPFIYYTLETEISEPGLVTSIDLDYIAWHNSQYSVSGSTGVYIVYRELLQEVWWLKSKRNEEAAFDMFASYSEQRSQYGRY